MTCIIHFEQNSKRTKLTEIALSLDGENHHED